MKMYALFNYTTGEVRSMISPTCQALYKRAISDRRSNVYYGYAQDNMRLIACDGYDYENLRKGVIIQEWKGGLNTPIEDLGLTVRVYYSLKRRKVDTVEQMLDYVKTEDVFRRLPTKALYQIVHILRAYDKATAENLTRRINERKIKR